MVTKQVSTIPQLVQIVDSHYTALDYLDVPYYTALDYLDVPHYTALGYLDVPHYLSLIHI